MYVIRRTDQGGGWVSRPGSRGSYTHHLQTARIYRTREQADAERCVENEVTEAVADLLPTVDDLANRLL